MKFKDYYAILGVPRDATEDDIRSLSQAGAQVSSRCFQEANAEARQKW
jgi:hypothetical protein